jgi:hypothetical protein
MFKAIPNLGQIPTKGAPSFGHEISISVEGLPPYKDLHASIRNTKHRHHPRFVALRHAATEAMDGRCWSTEAIALWISVFTPGLDKNKNLSDDLGGITDTLDGTHGKSFTYLSVCFQDDCQVSSAGIASFDSGTPHYEIRIQF